MLLENRRIHGRSGQRRVKDLMITTGLFRTGEADSERIFDAVICCVQVTLDWPPAFRYSICVR